MVSCSHCGNVYFVVLQTLSNDVVIDAPSAPTAYCPGCGSVYQHRDGAWVRETRAMTMLQGLRMLTNKLREMAVQS